MDDLRQSMVKLDDYNRNGAPLYMRFGLYSGNTIYKRSLLPNLYADGRAEVQGTDHQACRG